MTRDREKLKDKVFDEMKKAFSLNKGQKTFTRNLETSRGKQL
jgi:hypothetical protein